MSVKPFFAIAVGDTWSDWIGGFHFEKLDVLPLGGDVLLQYRVHGAAQPEGGQPVRAGLPKSFPGLPDVYGVAPDAVRFQRRQAGVGATVDADLWSIA